MHVVEFLTHFIIFVKFKIVLLQKKIEMTNNLNRREYYVYVAFSIGYQ